MSHDNDFPENHDALRTRTHARPRPAKKPLAAQEGQRIPMRRADERAYPVETPGRSSESRAPRAAKHPLPKHQRRGPQKPYSPLLARALRSHSSCSASCIGKALDPSTSW